MAERARATKPREFLPVTSHRYRALFDLTDQVAIVTGGGGGPGGEVAKGLADFGSRLVIADLVELRPEAGRGSSR